MQAELFLPSHTEPRVTGVAVAARLGNTGALKVAADWLRDKDEHEDAAFLDLLAYEFDTRVSQARQVRQVLRANDDEYKTNDKPTLPTIRWFLGAVGLPIEACGVTAAPIMTNTFLLLVPTDGEDVARTAESLVAFMLKTFPRSRFFPWFGNRAVTPAGRQAERVLDGIDARISEESNGRGRRAG